MSADRSHRQARGARSRADEFNAVLKSVFLTAGPKRPNSNCAESTSDFGVEEMLAPSTLLRSRLVLVGFETREQLVGRPYRAK